MKRLLAANMALEKIVADKIIVKTSNIVLSQLMGRRVAPMT